MDFAVSNRPLDKIKADALVIGLGKKSDLPEVLPDATRKQISAFIKAGDFNGSKGQHARRIWLPLASCWSARATTPPPTHNGRRNYAAP